MPKNSINKYRSCVAICGGIDFDDRATIRRNNSAVTRMRKIVQDTEAVDELLPLLEEPEAAQWLAFQLLELRDVTPEISRKCLRIIRELAEGDSVEAYGRQLWLKEYRTKLRGERR